MSRPGQRSRRPVIAVVGSGQCDAQVGETARELGTLIARRGGVLVTGGLGGVMAAASEGAHAEGGLVIGILPGLDASAANDHVDVAIPTGLGELRNGLVVSSAGAVIALPGEWGTLAEIALALGIGKTVIGLDTWVMTLHGEAATSVERVSSAPDAVERAFAAA